MVANTQTRLTLDECHAKVRELLDLASAAESEAYRVMLIHMGETWQRIAVELEKTRDH